LFSERKRAPRGEGNQASKGRKGSSKERFNKVASARILAGNRVHV